MKQTLTARQKEILEFIREFITSRGFPPTIREICSQFHFRSLRTVQVHLSKLEVKGYIRRRTGASRGLEILGSLIPGIPILGRISAGIPMDAIENFEGELPVQRAFFGSHPHFALRVNGDSMAGAGILDGDYCIIKQQDSAEESQIVAAVIDGDATVKRLIKADGAHWVLHPENPAYEDIPLSPDSLRICGIVVGVWRELS